MNIEDLLKNKDWKVFDLRMTKFEFEDFTNKIIFLNEVRLQIYVHVSVDKILQNEVLRIGTATNGIINRWIKSSSGHGSTFLWSIGESYKYKSYAKDYPNYLIFFAELKNINTKLYVLNCETKESMLNIEKELIKYFNPIWEQFKKPIRNYFKINQDIKKLVIPCGGAIKIINKDFNDIPNIINFKSNRKWQLQLNR